MSKIRCGFCKDYFDREDPNVVRVGPQSFCSSEHRVAAANKVTGKPRKKATPKPKKEDDFTTEIKREARARDGNRCRFCGRNYALHVHHIVYRSGGGTHDPWNLITLCKEHHDLVHSNKRLYQPMLNKIVELRMDGDKTTLVVMLELYRTQVRKR